MKKLVYLSILMLLAVACGQSYEETKRLSRLERQRKAKEDSAALKIAVMPTLDCLPLLVARQYSLFDTLGADVRIKFYSSHLDCDTAILFKRVEGMVTDLVRAERLVMKGEKLEYCTSTDAYWQLVSNRNSRIKELKQMDDKMMAMTRFSVTDMLGDYAVDSAKLKDERVYRVQINDVRVRLQMLHNNEMDVQIFTEPQATEALVSKHKMLLDTRRLDWRMGAFVFRDIVKSDSTRKQQYSVFVRAYNMACDSINKYGISRYRDLVTKYCQVKSSTVDSIKNYKFTHVSPPREKDVETARKWLKKKL
ncbi:MAG: ABC transporter substrate-binding protein [Prevotella sp.]